MSQGSATGGLAWGSTAAVAAPATERWPAERARAWSAGRAWSCGFNYVPSTAVNSTEIWQSATFDATTIDRELGWAGALGLNACRIFLPFLVWQADPDGLIKRIDRFLELADRHGLATMLVLFDDCAFGLREPYLGPQDPPTPGIHNSGWTPSPGHARVVDRAVWLDLERYIQAVVGAFAADPRVLAWDVYNEPGNAGMGAKTLPLLEAVFDWARACRPTQPLTGAVWGALAGRLDPAVQSRINDVLIARSDILSFHSYHAAEALVQTIAGLAAHERPLLCTEWLARGRSDFATHLPIFARERVGSFFWGLVNGRTQTQYPWGSPGGGSEPDLWFHDLLRTDGSFYLEAERAVLRAYLPDRAPAHEA